MFHKSIRYCVVAAFEIVLYIRLIQKIMINFTAGNFQIPSLGIYINTYVCVSVCVCVCVCVLTHMYRELRARATVPEQP